jgi:hypothetical protein
VSAAVLTPTDAPVAVSAARCCGRQRTKPDVVAVAPSCSYTITFQAPGFYERLGYRRFGAIDCDPRQTRLGLGQAVVDWRASRSTIDWRHERPAGQLIDREKGRWLMRFMMMVKASEDWETGKMPNPEHIAAVMRYKEELRRADVLVDVAALHPTAESTRIRFSGGKPLVTDGPFAETREVIGGYWLIQVKSKAEAIEWAKRAPQSCGSGEDSQLELRQLCEMDEFEPAERRISSLHADELGGRRP